MSSVRPCCGICWFSIALAISCISSVLISSRICCFDSMGRGVVVGIMIDDGIGATTGVDMTGVGGGGGARRSMSPVGADCGGLNADMRSSTSQNSNDVEAGGLIEILGGG